MYHFAVEVEDMASLARVLRRLKNTGVPVGGSSHEISLALYFREPEGTEGSIMSTPGIRRANS
jgi:catechol-2,3-dioxygenase